MGPEQKETSPVQKPVLQEYDNGLNFAKWYLGTYYSDTPTEDEREISKFGIEQANFFPKNAKFLEIGCGPTTHHLFPFTPHVSSIHVADYREDNREEVNKWRIGAPDSHDWSKYIAMNLENEGILPTEDAVERRKAETQSKMQPPILTCDVRSAVVVQTETLFDVVGCYFVAEEVGTNLSGWEQVMANICGVVPKGGIFLMSALRDMDKYHVKSPSGEEDWYPCAAVTEKHFEGLLPKLGFGRVTVRPHIISDMDVGIPGIVMVSAVRL